VRGRGGRRRPERPRRGGVDLLEAPTFTDLCRGPHVPATSRLGTSSSCAWPAPTGVATSTAPAPAHLRHAFESEKALAEHLERLEEAERRDHRKLGAELDLFSFPEEIGSGLAVFHPKGGTIRRLMEDYSRQRHVEAATSS